jgi:HAD superfamily hydrolase (TIGR01509 family)
MTVPRMDAVRWVFLDVGNVLLDEDPLTFRVLLRHAEAAARARPGLTVFDVLAAREARALAGSRWPLYEAVVPVLGEAGCADVWEAAGREVRDDFAALSPVIPGAEALVEHLARRYRLGLIANQGRECRARLEALGLLGRFEVVALAEELGLFKPDPALFRLAAERAGADPRECLMVGDRPDNDLAPAAALGMATAWVRWPRRAAKGWDPPDPPARAYLASLERLEALAPAPDPAPGLAVATVADLAARCATG